MQVQQFRSREHIVLVSAQTMYRFGLVGGPCMVFLKDDIQIHCISAETNITLALEQDIEIKVLLKLTTFEMKMDIGH